MADLQSAAVAGAFGICGEITEHETQRLHKKQISDGTGLTHLGHHTRPAKKNKLKKLMEKHIIVERFSTKIVLQPLVATITIVMQMLPPSPSAFCSAAKRMSFLCGSLKHTASSEFNQISIGNLSKWELVSLSECGFLPGCIL